MNNKILSNIYSIFSKIFDFLSMKKPTQKTDTDDNEETTLIFNKMHMGL